MKKIFDSIFHDRKIVIISDEKMSSLAISRNIQLFLAIGLIGFLAWLPFSAGRIAAFDDFNSQKIIISENIDNVEQRVYLLERNLTVLEQYLDALYKTGNFKIKDDEYSNTTPKEDVDKITELEVRKNKIIGAIYYNTFSRIKQIERMLKNAEVNYVDIIGKKPPISAQGGPYIPVNISDYDNVAYADLFNEEFVENFRYLFDLQNVVQQLPFMSPIDGPRVTSGFGYRRDPYSSSMAMHSGVDLAGKLNSYVYATAPGKVIFAGRKGAYGNAIDIKNEMGFIVRYAHLKKISVNKGHQIKRGDIIGVQGSTGRSTGDHLHYEVRINNKPVNPMKFLSQANNIRYYHAVR